MFVSYASCRETEAKTWRKGKGADTSCRETTAKDMQQGKKAWTDALQLNLLLAVGVPPKVYNLSTNKGVLKVKPFEFLELKGLILNLGSSVSPLTQGNFSAKPPER